MWKPTIGSKSVWTSYITLKSLKILMIHQHTFAWNGQSEGTKTPCWMANDALGQEKQRDYITAKPHLTAISIGGHPFIRPIFLRPIGDRIINRIPLYYPNSYYLFFSRVPLGCMSSSLCGGALRDDTKNGCVADRMPSSKVSSGHVTVSCKGPTNVIGWRLRKCSCVHGMSKTWTQVFGKLTV